MTQSPPTPSPPPPPPNPPPSPRQGSGAPANGTPQRERFTQRELDDVLGRYELGEVRTVREMALGTPASPKALVDCARGAMLLKRRARGVDTPELVAFSHALMLGCLRAGVCVPPLVGTRDANNSMVQTDERIYELFVYIEGTPDPRTPAAAERAGALLGELHRAMDTVSAGGLGWTTPVEASVIEPGRADRHGAIDDEVRAVVRGVLERAASHSAGGRALVHGDWHPGNLVFRGDEPVAVCDFDNARSGSRAREVAQGLVQFSLTRGEPGEPPERWSASADLERLTAHWRGYAQAASEHGIDPGAVMGLMPGVLMDEVLGSATPDPRVVWMVLRKAQWLEDRADEIAARLADPDDRSVPLA